MPANTPEGSSGDDAAARPAMIVAPRGEHGVGGRVLLVDDDEVIRRIYSRILRRVGCVVETAASGAAALEILRTGSFDLIVSDIAMAGMSGIEFLRAVREQNLDVPVILMTGESGVETTREAVDYGAFRYLIKPVPSDTFAQAVRSAIHTHVVAQALAERAPFLEACRRLVRVTCQGSDWDFATIWVPGDGDRMHCAETWSRPGYDAAVFDNATRTVDVEVGRGFARSGWTCDSPDWLPDISADSSDPRVRFAVAAGFQSSFSVPIGAEGEVFAVLEFFSRTHRAPDLNLLELFATSGAQLSAQVLRQRAEQRATRAETAEKAIKVTLDAVLESAPAFILAVDEHGKIQFINKVLPHFKIVDVLGSDWLQYLQPGDEDQHRARLRRILTTGVSETYEASVVGLDGGLMSFTTHIGPLRDNDRIVGAVLVGQDVTELKRSQAEAAGARQLAAVGSIAAGVAHEINTPIQFVNDSLHFLRDASREIFQVVDKLQEVRRLTTDGATAPGLAEAIAAAVQAEEEADLAYLRENVPSALERCIDGTARITTIVRSMKEFAHPARAEMAPVDLNRAIQSTLTIANTEFKYVADLEVDLGELPLVTCHVNEINQVVLNLVVNAAHAIGDVVKGGDGKGVITVRTRRDGESVLISIGDTGTGIPAAIAQRVFEPFFTTKASGHGTGQGLALVRAVIKDRHNGDVSFESKDGCGTTFTVRLPIIAGSEPGTHLQGQG
jgi:PAS domain S-box-containing protein